MIVRDCSSHFLLVTQHEHAKVSGEIATVWDRTFFYGLNQWSSVMYAIEHHDASWLPLDDQPLWNEVKQAPYSFMDYPINEKLTAYKGGIDALERDDRYAALLCSCHYTSFFDDVKQLGGLSRQFLIHEQQRQQQLIRELKREREVDTKNFHFHFDLLQFCDNLSLYICLHEPGTKKENEVSWFRSGFPQQFSFFNQRRVVAHWLDTTEVSLSPFPLKDRLMVSIEGKEVNKEAIREVGLEQAYRDAPNRCLVVRLVPGDT
ncbi:DUF3891 family protein [Desertibacillus haloalkaliphilus]|uniref:DUF3891 family protein n=1 Tax=Desertibacillus haloalkaliphilus TaxID=1328930 RepID=UPI001C2737A9|nr:DUF3891 family protein [Desertibacillus haloalkaliphilus]MBU8907303.1 DUF3891 family protein [Desertibacillus haloalkaliphilus]